jgi:hypothetical protein
MPKNVSACGETRAVTDSAAAEIGSSGHLDTV